MLTFTLLCPLMEENASKDHPPIIFGLKVALEFTVLTELIMKL